MRRSLFRCRAMVPRLKLSFFLLIYAFMLVSSPAVFAAFEKSSKKECAICHVMWLDEFRANKETLIKWQPGNVLMKKTQGVVSSEAMCYSCHDGYVVDSRYTAWDHHNHPTFVKPPKSMKIPDTFPLSNKGEIYCGTCHSPHSGEWPTPGAIPAQIMPGPLFFLRAPNVDSGMCEQCHKDQADYKQSHSHPVHAAGMKIPEKLFKDGSVQAEKPDTVICQTCHEVHGAKGRDLTVIDNRESQLCMTCHKERTITGTMHDMRLTMPGETNMKGESVSEAGPCSACHVPHNSAGYMLWARKPVSGNPASTICLSCHTGKPGSRIKGIGRHSHPTGVDVFFETDRQFGGSASAKQLPLFSKAGKQQAAGTVQCFTCHNIHQWNPASSADKGGKDAKADASNSFLRISDSKSSALCLKCHQDKRQILAHDHNLALTAPKSENIRGETVKASGPCGACHIPHNAVDKRLWARNLPRDRNSAPQYCISCHSATGVAKEKQVGKNDHPVDVVLKGPQIPPAGKVAKKLPLFTRKGNTRGGDRIRCLTCHDPHNWSPTGAITGHVELAAAGKAAAEKNIEEGDARNSFLRKPASPKPDLCAVCHETAELIVGTDHDLFITAPSAKNLLGQTVKESGQCGVCHALHNSPKKHLLWARAYGPVSDNQPSMDGLCTSCHNKNGIAKDKVPPVASHPRGKLIDNIRTYTGKPTGYIKIFDKNWKEVNVGDLSCSSCHSFQWWDHRVRKPGPGKKVEGNADTSFLRTASDRTVCIDCHGQTAIWRYLYFHSLQKRKMLKDVRP